MFRRVAVSAVAPALVARAASSNVESAAAPIPESTGSTRTPVEGHWVVWRRDVTGGVWSEKSFKWRADAVEAQKVLQAEHPDASFTILEEDQKPDPGYEWPAATLPPKQQPQALIMEHDEDGKPVFKSPATKQS